MYEDGEEYAHEEEESEEIQNELWQEACWIVISAYFEEKGTTKQTVILYKIQDSTESSYYTLFENSKFSIFVMMLQGLMMVRLTIQLALDKASSVDLTSSMLISWLVMVQIIG